MAALPTTSPFVIVAIVVYCAVVLIDLSVVETVADPLSGNVLERLGNGV